MYVRVVSIPENEVLKLMSNLLQSSCVSLKKCIVVITIWRINTSGRIAFYRRWKC